MTAQPAGTAGSATSPHSGYAKVNGLEMYYESHGSGRPLVLLHGGVVTLDLSFGALIPELAASHRVIAVELQGHGRTADSDREMTVPALAGDVVALLDVLGIERADFFGFSLGGMTSLETAIRHPDRVDRLVLASVGYRADGYLDEVRDPALFATSTRLPTQDDFQEMMDAYTAIAPHPEHFHDFMAKTSVAAQYEGWSQDELRGIAASTLLVFGDTDFIRLDHAVEMHGLFPDAQLAVLPGCTHMDVMRRRDLILPMVTDFLDRADDRG